MRGHVPQNCKKRLAHQDCLFKNLFKKTKEKFTFDSLLSFGIAVEIFFLVVIWLPSLQFYLSNCKKIAFRVPDKDGEQYIYIAHLLNIWALGFNQIGMYMIVNFANEINDEKDVIIYKTIKCGLTLHNRTKRCFSALLLCYILLFILSMTTIIDNHQYINYSSIAFSYVIPVILIIGGFFTAKADCQMGFIDICKDVDIPFVISMIVLLIFFILLKRINHSNSFQIGLSSGALALQLILATLLAPPSIYSTEAIKGRSPNNSEAIKQMKQ